MEKKSLRISALILLIVIGVILFVVLMDKKQNLREDALKFKEEYEKVNFQFGTVQMDISQNNPIVYIESYEELNKKISNKDNFVLYLGFPTCPWCRNIIPVLFETAAENKVNEVYYINVREMKSNTEDYQKLYDLVYDYLEENEGQKVIYVPDVYFFQDGNIVGHHLGSVDSQTNPTIPLTEIQKKRLKDIYQNYFEIIK